MERAVKVACVQVEPVIFDRDATIEKVATLAREIAAEGAALAVFPETFVPVYPSSRWARFLAGSGEAKETFGRLARESLEVPSPASERLGEIARDAGIWLAIGANELDRGTIYNALLLYDASGDLVLHRRKLMPTNHERLVWGLGGGEDLRAIATPLGRVGGLICWENLMPLARFALYQDGVEIYLAPTADDSEDWHESIRHIAREARAFVVSPWCSSAPRAIPTRCRSRTGRTCSAAAAPRSSAPTASISPVRCGTRRASCTPSSTHGGCTRRSSGSTPPATTTAPTSSS